MKDKTIIDTFNHYISYWIVKLELDKKYKFDIKKDNRISAYADVCVEKNLAIIRFNTKRFKHKWQIISVVLHELGHLLYDFRSGNDGEHEYVAELFSLSMAKKHYPEFYNKMVNWTKKAIKKCDPNEVSKAHLYGYTKALTEIGEL